MLGTEYTLLEYYCSRTELGSSETVLHAQTQKTMLPQSCYKTYPPEQSAEGAENTTNGTFFLVSRFRKFETFDSGGKINISYYV